MDCRQTKAREIEVKYCPTENIIADCFTKPLSSSSFTTLRDIYQGIILISELEKNHSLKNNENQSETGLMHSNNHKECVGHTCKRNKSNKTSKIENEEYKNDKPMLSKKMIVIKIQN